MEAIPSDRLTPFEFYMLADDTPEYPMTFMFRLRFRGEIRKPLFDAAFADVVCRHPLLHATVQHCRGRHPRWLVHQDRYPSVLLHSLGEPLSSGSLPHIDLKREFGMRTWFASESDQTEIWFQFHHACCDAISALRLMDELFTRYRFGLDNSTTDHASTWDRRLRGRRRYAVSPCWAPLQLPQNLRRTMQFFRQLPTQLPTGLEPNAADHRFPASLAQEIAAPDGQQRLAADSRSGRITVNDRLLAAVFAAVGRWCRRHDVADSACLRIAVPINLRADLQTDSTCANCVSLVFVDRHVSATTATAELMASISAEMSQVKTQKLGLSMLRALAVICSLPGGMNRVLDLPRCFTTTVLSNLGVVFKHSRCATSGQRVCLGDAVLDSIDFLPPIRRGTIAVFGALTYADRLSFSMHYDPRLLTAQHAIQLFGDVVDSVPPHLKPEHAGGAVPCG